MRPLYKHQELAVEWLRPRSHGALFMEMRLGKTLTVIRTARLWNCERALVVAPLTVLGSWADELTRELEDWFLLRGAGRLRALQSRKRGWYLVNYEQLRSASGQPIVDAPWDLVVLDESARIRNPKAKVTKVCTRGFRNVPHRVILSGLPAPESPLNYVEQFRFLDGQFMGFKNYWSARDRLFNQWGYDLVPKKGTKERIKRYVHEHAFVLTRKQAGLGNVKVYEKREVETNALQRRLTKQVLDTYTLKHKATRHKIVAVQWLAQIASGIVCGRLVSKAKLNELVELLKGELAEERVLVFYRYNAQLYGTHVFLAKHGLNSRVITGGTPVDERDRIRHQFQKGNVRILLLQINCAKYGLDLSKASAAIYFSNSYSAEARYQSEDRIEHPSKKSPLLYIDLQSRQTIDEEIVKALREKKVSSAYFASKVLEQFLGRNK